MPPLVGVAVNVMLAPAQIVVDAVPMVTEGVNTGLTVITIGVLVAVNGLAHVAVLVITTS